MATIVDIRSASRDSASRASHSGERASRAGQASKQASAEILLFTGIRYERWGDAPAEPRSLKADGRDRLDLDE